MLLLKDDNVETPNMEERVNINENLMKSEQGWLRVNRSRNIDAGFLWEAAVCSD